MNRREFGMRLLGAAGMLALDPLGLEAQARAALALPRIDGERLMEQLFALAEYGKTPEGGTHRVAYSEADRKGREYVIRLMRQARLEVEVDAAGNLIGRRAGREPDLKPIAFGSHIDSVPHGGKYDGPVGSLAAIEAARTLQEQGITTRHPLEVMVFSNEEGGKTGSRVLIGAVMDNELELDTASGRTIREGIRFIGGDPDRLASIRREPGDVAAFLELHIEQGGVLEAEDVDIGVVEGIVGIKRWLVTVNGFANHAGTTPMDQRQDALLAAAKFVEAVNETIRSVPGRQVGTVGKLEARPGAPNVIPGQVVTTLEIRDLDGGKVDRLFGEIRARAEEIGQGTGTKFDFEHIYTSEPAPTQEAIRQMVEASAADLALRARRMPSGAGHDAQSMAKLGPMGMIFVPSVGGISHSPQEFTEAADIINGANVLLRSVLALDRRLMV